MGFGNNPTTSTQGSLPSDQIYLSSVATPDTANGDLTALEGGPVSTDTNSNKTAPASVYLKDGRDVTQGAKADTASTDATTSNTKMAFLKGLVKMLADIWDSTNHRVRVDGSGVTQPVSAAALPLPSGAATSAKQPALGTAGTASADVLSVQGVASMTALKTDGSGVTQPVSGTVSITANSAVNVAQVAGTTTDTNSGSKSAGTQRIVIATDQPQLTNALKVDGSGVTQPVSGTVAVSNLPGTQPVSGTVTANAGSGTFTNQQSNITSDYDTGAGTQTMTMFGVALPASGGSVAGGTSSNPLRTDPTGVTTQPVSASSLPLPSGASTSAKQPALGTAGTASSDVLSVQGIASMTALKTDGSGVTQPVSGSVTVSATNLQTNLNQVAGSAIGTAATGIMKVGLTDGSGTAITSTGAALDVNVKSGSGGFSAVDEAAWTAGSSNVEPIGGVFNDSAAALTSGQQGTARLTNNRAIHVNLRDASANQLLGSKTSANSVPVVVASDQGAIPASQSGTWTVQPGNTANTTPWLQTQYYAGCPSYIFKEIKQVSVTAGTGLSIWTPANGKKFRLMGFCLYPGGTGTYAILLLDTVVYNASNEFIRVPHLGSANTVPTQHRFEPYGYLSTAANNQLWVDVTTTGTVDGYVYGFEE